MNIGINGLFLIPGKVGGSETCFRNLVLELAKSDNQNKYYIFLGNEANDYFKSLPKNFKVITTPFESNFRPGRILWEQIVLPIQVFLLRLNVLHSAGYTAPLFLPCKSLTTIFDLNYHFHPEDFTKTQLLIFKTLIPLVARSTDKIITYSQNSKKDMIKVLKVDPNKFIVTFAGVDDSFFKRESKAKIKNKYKLNSDFILSAAVSHPHKNLTALIEAFKIYKSEKKDKIKLVLLGFPGKAFENLKDQIKRSNLQDDVLITGWVPQEDVPGFYQTAKVFVTPSLYEGFGIPVIEAMASQTPVISSNAASLPEIVGDAGLLVDAKDPVNIVKAIKKLADSPELRQILVEKGKKRVKKYNWGDSTKIIYKGYLNS